MNQRIKQLTEQAGGNPNYKAFRGYFLPPPPDYIDPATVDLEKFAELIVRECGVALSPMLRDMISRGQAYDLIKQHFGVTE